MIEWTLESLASLPLEGLKNRRANAERQAHKDLVALCDAELSARKPKKSVEVSAARAPGDFVVGFHFVCDRGRGVSKNSDDTYWTGTWVVDKAHAEKASKIGAYVALHETKSEPSYLQGIVRDWRVGKRERQYAEDQLAKTETGIEFLFDPTSKPYQWVGDGAGEKGYAWASIVKSKS